MTAPTNPESTPRESQAEMADIRPGTITRIAPQRRAQNRFNIEIDGRYGFSLAEDVLVRAGLATGDSLDESAIAELLAGDERARATEAALAFLAYRPRSEKEVRDRLRRSQFSQDAIDHVISRLHEWHYLDDADFARRWVENRATHRPRGSRLLQQELRQKGIDRETARDAIAEAELDETAAAEQLARGRASAYAGEDPAVMRRRLGAYLARRGYSYDVVRVALERALGEPEESDESPPE
jgi:regulatory protein